MKEIFWMIAKDPFSNCLNSPFSLSVDSVIPPDTDKDLQQFDSLELCLYLHLCFYLYLYLSVSSYIPSERKVPQHLDSHKYEIYSIISLSFPIVTHFFVHVIAYEATVLQLVLSWKMRTLAVPLLTMDHLRKNRHQVKGHLSVIIPEIQAEKEVLRK